MMIHFGKGCQADMGTDRAKQLRLGPQSGAKGMHGYKQGHLEWIHGFG